MLIKEPFELHKVTSATKELYFIKMNGDSRVVRADSNLIVMKAEESIMSKKRKVLIDVVYRFEEPIVMDIHPYMMKGGDDELHYGKIIQVQRHNFQVEFERDYDFKRFTLKAADSDVLEESIKASDEKDEVRIKTRTIVKGISSLVDIEIFNKEKK